MDAATLTISRARTLLQAGELSPADLAAACFAAIEARNPLLNAFARTFDIREGDTRTSNTRLSNIPIAVKDLIDVAGVPTAAGSPRFLAANRPERRLRGGKTQGSGRAHHREDQHP